MKLPDWPVPTDLKRWQEATAPGPARCCSTAWARCRPGPDPGKVKVVSREEHDGYTLERFQFHNGVDMVVPGILLLPKDRKGPAPAVVGLHGHGSSKESVCTDPKSGQSSARAGAAGLRRRGHRRLLQRRARRQGPGRAHDATVRREVARFRGSEVKSLGDGFLILFDGPARAIHCAKAITEAMAPLGIKVRAGLHTGEVERTESDVLGIAVHLAARIMDTASASEVVLSRTVKDLVAGSGIAFDDAGEHSLKGSRKRGNCSKLGQSADARAEKSWWERSAGGTYGVPEKELRRLVG